MANVRKNSTNDSTHHVWNFLWSECQRVGFWCRCTWFGFLESRLIRSNNQSRATLWVLETCLLVGLLPLMIILITASLSSNTNNKASWCEDWTFEGTQSILFSALIFPWDLWLLSKIPGRPVLSIVWITFPIKSHNSRAKAQSNLNPRSKEMISDSVELCERQFVYCTSDLLEQMSDFQKRTMFLQKWILNPQHLPQNQSWNNPSLQWLAILPTWQYCL